MKVIFKASGCTTAVTGVGIEGVGVASRARVTPLALKNRFGSALSLPRVSSDKPCAFGNSIVNLRRMWSGSACKLVSAK